MNDTKVTQTARRIKAFGKEYTVQGECVDGFIVHIADPRGFVAETIIFRTKAEVISKLPHHAARLSGGGGKTTNKITS